MGSILRDKGWEKPFWMQFLVVVTYLGSTLFGSVIYILSVALCRGAEGIDTLGLSVYLAAYVGAALGVGLLFLSTKLINPKLTIEEISQQTSIK